MTYLHITKQNVAKIYRVKINWKLKINNFLRKKMVEIKCFGNQRQPISNWETLLSVMTHSMTKVCIT